MPRRGGYASIKCERRGSFSLRMKNSTTGSFEVDVFEVVRTLQRMTDIHCLDTGRG
jgi:hypothetical protein